MTGYQRTAFRTCHGNIEQHSPAGFGFRGLKSIWLDDLKMSQRNYAIINTGYDYVLKLQPFYAVHGRQPQSLSAPVLGDASANVGGQDPGSANCALKRFNQVVRPGHQTDVIKLDACLLERFEVGEDAFHFIGESFSFQDLRGLASK